MPEVDLRESFCQGLVTFKPGSVWMLDLRNGKWHVPITTHLKIITLLPTFNKLPESTDASFFLSKHRSIA
jgi:hypothetical protein